MKHFLFFFRKRDSESIKLWQCYDKPNVMIAKGTSKSIWCKSQMIQSTTILRMHRLISIRLRPVTLSWISDCSLRQPGSRLEQIGQAGRRINRLRHRISFQMYINDEKSWKKKSVIRYDTIRQKYNKRWPRMNIKQWQSNKSRVV